MLSYKNLQITYCDPETKQDSVKINYRLRSTATTAKWVERVLLAKRLGYPIDDPTRFYGFGPLETQEVNAVKRMTEIVSKLKNWIPVSKQLESVYDQDTLNYLHHIFETEHGLLDKQIVDKELQQTLCDLNLMVHRCESIARGACPRHVVTYFGLPKTEMLTDDDYTNFETKIQFGSVYINYAEIGKTLYDFYLDNDSYINPSAFQPFRHFSADFVVKFWDNDQTDLHDNLYAYYYKHLDFFAQLGYGWNELSRSIGNIPVADLDKDLDLIKILETRQYVKAVEFS